MSQSVFPPEARVLFFSRHGETAWNREERWQGQTDIGLNERGRAQAVALAARLVGRGIRDITASDLSRARETAEIIARHLGIADVTVDADLRERGYGVFEGLTREQCETQHSDDWSRYLADRTYTPTRAELQDQVVTRMRAAVARAAARAAGHGHPVLIVGHGGSIRAVLHADTGSRPPPLDNGGTIRALFGAAGLRDAELLPG
ncbi:MAG TPA: histidine phosphatase family protein [Polyangia bacterium]|nr:histidine phosphatase family protein [Polyangia bacterium]